MGELGRQYVSSHRQPVSLRAICQSYLTPSWSHLGNRPVVVGKPLTPIVVEWPPVGFCGLEGPAASGLDVVGSRDADDAGLDAPLKFVDVLPSRLKRTESHHEVKDPVVVVIANGCTSPRLFEVHVEGRGPRPIRFQPPPHGPRLSGWMNAHDRSSLPSLLFMVTVPAVWKPFTGSQ